jgi:hypothetical protein
MAIPQILSFAAAFVLVLAALPLSCSRRIALVALTNTLHLALFGAAAGTGSIVTFAAHAGRSRFNFLRPPPIAHRCDRHAVTPVVDTLTV